MSDSIKLEDVKPSDLPSPPQAALQILRACSQDEISTTEISDLASTDPVLTAELLRIVNTPLFGFSREVQSLSQAVAIMGQRALRNMVLCLAVREAVNQHPIKGFDTTAFWEDSLRRAVSAKLLGAAVVPRYEDFFSNGLLQDFGLLVMFYLRPDKVSAYSRMHTLDPNLRMQAEQELFQTTHVEVVQILIRAWDLPEELATLLGSHHQCEENKLSTQQSKICAVLECADWMAAVYGAENKADVHQHTLELLHTRFELAETAVNEMLTEIPAQTESSAVSLGLRIKQQVDFERVMRQANSRLAEANLSYQELTWKLEQTLTERDRLAAELDTELKLAREVQQSLLPDDQEGLPIFGVNASARELSGDFYDYFTLRDGRILFNLADVSGKGVNAALLMAKASSLFHCLGKFVHDPSRMLTQINNEICETSIRGMFVTMIAGLYDPKTGDVLLINAGHPSALLQPAQGKMQMIDAMAPPLGVVPDQRYPEPVSINIKGGCLYLFSDGVTEGELVKGEMLGMRGVARVLLENRNQPAKARLLAVVDRFKAVNQNLRDDLTLMVLEG